MTGKWRTRLLAWIMDGAAPRHLYRCGAPHLNSECPACIEILWARLAREEAAAPFPAPREKTSRLPRPS